MWQALSDKLKWFNKDTRTQNYNGVTTINDAFMTQVYSSEMIRFEDMKDDVWKPNQFAFVTQLYQTLLQILLLRCPTNKTAIHILRTLTYTMLTEDFIHLLRVFAVCINCCDKSTLGWENDDYSRNYPIVKNWNQFTYSSTCKYML